MSPSPLRSLAIVGVALLPLTARADVRRVAIVAANNDGGMVYRPLYFAEDDAEKIEDVLVSVGGYADSDVSLVLPATRARVEDAFADARRRVQLAHSDGDDVVFLFYYSGHGDEEQLLMGDSNLTYANLEELLAGTGADVRLAFLDACNSGAAARSKGGSRVPAFDVDLAERLDTRGTVVITSSSGDEASQESDEIGGSYFTHFLASGLLGAADADADGRVTLTEAYAHVYDETVIHTATSRIGAQHPTFSWELAGEGDLVLAELDPARAVLELPADRGGVYAIFDVQRRAYIAEVSSDEAARRLHLRPGRYQVQQRFPTMLTVADLTVGDGDRVSLDDLQFRPLEYEDNLAKGAIDARIRRARMPDSSVRLAVGSMGADQAVVRSAYLPEFAVGGGSWRIGWRDGRWLSVDLLAGGGGDALLVDDVLSIPTDVAGTTVGVGAGYATAPRLFQAGVGLRADLLWLQRSFDPAQGIDAQHLVTVTPGLDLWAGMHLRRFELELAWRELIVAQGLDDAVRSFSMHQLLLSAGYRF